MDMEVLVICIGHTARAAEGRERQIQAGPKNATDVNLQNKFSSRMEWTWK